MATPFRSKGVMTYGPWRTCSITFHPLNCSEDISLSPWRNLHLPTDPSPCRNSAYLAGALALRILMRSPSPWDGARSVLLSTPPMHFSRPRGDTHQEPPTTSVPDTGAMISLRVQPFT